MKKEQLKEAVGELNLVVTEFEADGMCYMDRAVSVTQVYDLIDQLDEPVKVVVPQFVTDWIDAHNLYGNNPLREYRDLENDFNEGWTDEKDASVYHWINKNPYTFIDALRYGCEAEKEKLYVVSLIDNHVTYYLSYDLMNKVFFMSRNQKEKLNKFKKRFTEQEIKDHDERFYQFAEEVAE